MRKLIVLLAFSTINLAFSQSGKVYLKNSKFIVGAENTYVYQPSKGTAIPNNAKAFVGSGIDYNYFNEQKDLIKKGNLYEFSTKLPDSARSMLVTIEKDGKAVDNNKNQGYAVILRKENKTELSRSLFNQIYIRNFGNHILKLKLPAKSEDKIASYEQLFTTYPNLKTDKVYYYYLLDKYGNDMKSNKETFLAFADLCLKKNTEDYLTIASNIYREYNMTDKGDALNKEILKRYPDGILAKTNFMSEFYDHPDKTESYILESIANFKTRFKGENNNENFSFNYSLLNVYLKNKDFEKAKELESKFTNRNMAASSYNQTAWELSGQDLTTPAADPDFALKVSKRSLDIIHIEQKKSPFREYSNFFNMFADTYALLQYKKGNYEEAFKYQDSVKNNNGLDEGGKDRYLAMMQKVKPQNEIKNYIEDQLTKHEVTNPYYVSTLKEIYTAQNLPLDNYEKLKAKTEALAEAQKKKAVIDKYGSAVAKDFTLKNLESKEVKLSEYKGKVVVLDFWATWCGPCKASFPKMQELVEKYKGKDVEFLFVNTWEKGEDDEILKKVSDFITDKKYTFNVVLDNKREVVENYKIQGIPTRIVIDKNGNILNADSSDATIVDLIDEQLK